MSRTRFNDINCGVAQALDQLGDSWTLLIIRDALMGATRFQQFESNLGIAKNVLSDRLSKLVENGVLSKERLDEPGQRFEYKLTPKGRDLWIVLTAMRLWGDKWIFGEAKVPAVFRERGRGREVAGLIAVDADGVPVQASELEWAPGPGWPKGVNVEEIAPWESPPLSRTKRNRKKARAPGSST
jgi:DNA-binding HxlR family transcriptional regulator